MSWECDEKVKERQFCGSERASKKEGDLESGRRRNDI
jgi:hypothetical protein